MFADWLKFGKIKYNGECCVEYLQTHIFHDFKNSVIQGYVGESIVNLSVPPTKQFSKVFSLSAGNEAGDIMASYCCDNGSNHKIIITPKTSCSVIYRRRWNRAKLNITLTESLPHFCFEIVEGDASFFIDEEYIRCHHYAIRA
ncbi:MAG: hypothetical protein V1870_02135 [Candidatus Aenigmatarchaeota archaeon]